MAKIIITEIFFVVILLLFAGAGYAQALEVITVPWVPGNPGIPHDTYNGVSTTFMAIARGGDGISYTYDWDFNGDGIYDASNTFPNPYDLSAYVCLMIKETAALTTDKITILHGRNLIVQHPRPGFATRLDLQRQGQK